MALELIADAPRESGSTEGERRAPVGNPSKSAKKTARKRTTKKARRGRSTITFPYGDLTDAIRVSREVFNRGGRCSLDELAASLQHDTINSGAFRNKTGAARMFGLIEIAADMVSLTPLGGRIVDEETEREALVEAFLNVELYETMFTQFRGSRLPPDSGIESVMVRLGVTPTQVTKARQAFQRSAQLAGFYSAGPDRLILPTGPVLTRSISEVGNQSPPDPPVRRASVGTDLPKVIDGLLEEAPWGAKWNEAEFKEWADLFERAARVHFKLPRADRSGL
jgi:hypothetical protein